MNQEYLTQYKSYRKQELIVTFLISVSCIVVVPIYYLNMYHTTGTLSLFLVGLISLLIEIGVGIQIHKKKMNFFRTIATEQLGQYSALNLSYFKAGRKQSSRPKLDKYFQKCTNDTEFMELLEYFNSEYSIYCYPFDLGLYQTNKKDPEFISKFIAYKTYMQNK